MADKIKLILKKWGQSIIELLIFFPVFFLIGIYTIPHPLLLLWFGFIGLYYLVGILTGQFFKRSQRIISILTGMIISAVGSYFLFDKGISQILSWALGTAAFARGFHLRHNRWEDIFPPAGLWVGLIEYFIGHFFFIRIEKLKPFSSIFAWVGMIYMVVILFTINFAQLKTASLPGDKEPVLPRAIKKHNRILIAIMLIFIGIVYFFDSLKKAVEWLINGIGFIIWRFIVLLADLLAPSSPQGPSEGGGRDIQGLLPPIEEKTPSIFDKIIEIFGIAIAILAGLVLSGLLVYALYKLFKKIAAWLARLYQMGREMEDYGGYVDEKESLMDLKGLGKDYVDRFRQWLTQLMEREPKWDELKTNKERTRYIYRHFLLRCIAAGYTFKGYLTPAEVGKELSQRNPEKFQDIEKLTAVYEHVRYGDKDIDDNKIEILVRTFLK